MAKAKKLIPLVDAPAYAVIDAESREFIYFMADQMRTDVVPRKSGLFLDQEGAIRYRERAMVESLNKVEHAKKVLQMMAGDRGNNEAYWEGRLRHWENFSADIVTLDVTIVSAGARKR
jgi:hypothetical protein